MGNFSGYLICTDIDGTFVDNGGGLIEKNLAAILKFIDGGGLFTVSTGRSARYIEEKYGESLKTNTYLVCLNGTMIFDRENKKVIYSAHMKKEAVRDIEKYAAKAERRCFHTLATSYEELSKIPEDEEIQKIVFVSKTEEETQALRKELEARYGDICEFCRSWPTGLEMLPSGINKGECIRKIRALLGEKVKKVIAVGDFENDLSMIKEADIGVATGNAQEAVRAAADIVTVSNEEGAIAKIIEELKPLC